MDSRPPTFSYVPQQTIQTVGHPPPASRRPPASIQSPTYPNHTASQPLTFFNNDIFSPTHKQHRDGFIEQQEHRKQRISLQAEKMYGPGARITQAQYDQAAAIVDEIEHEELLRLRLDSKRPYDDSKPEWQRQTNSKGREFHLILHHIHKISVRNHYGSNPIPPLKLAVCAIGWRCVLIFTFAPDGAAHRSPVSQSLSIDVMTRIYYLFPLAFDHADKRGLVWSSTHPASSYDPTSLTLTMSPISCDHESIDAGPSRT